MQLQKMEWWGDHSYFLTSNFSPPFAFRLHWSSIAIPMQLQCNSIMRLSALAMPLCLLYAWLMTEYELRIAAAERGEKRYTGKPCEQHAGGLRYTSNGACVHCTAEKADARIQKIRTLLKRNA